MNMKEFYKGQVEWHTEQIKRDREVLKSINERIKEQRKADREFVEFVWSSGVVTDWEMSIYNKEYKSTEMENAINDRRWYYNDIKWHKERREKQEKMLERYAH